MSKKRKFIGYATGFTPIMRSVKSGMRVAAMPFPIFTNFFKMVTAKVRKTPVGKIKDMQARYRFALEYYGYTNEEQEIRQLKGRRNLAYTHTHLGYSQRQHGGFTVFPQGSNTYPTLFCSQWLIFHCRSCVCHSVGKLGFTMLK